MKLYELKRGMRCTFRNGTVIYVDDVKNGTIFYLERSSIGGMMCDGVRDDLTNATPILDIMKVEDITLNGYKTIWEREEDKYYLRLPSEYHYDSFLNYSRLNRRYYFYDKYESKLYKTQFTLDEIKGLPNQDFIDTLEKELVE